MTELFDEKEFADQLYRFKDSLTMSERVEVHKKLKALINQSIRKSVNDRLDRIMVELEWKYFYRAEFPGIRKLFEKERIK